jgi:hypothetical protein
LKPLLSQAAAEVVADRHRVLLVVVVVLVVEVEPDE